MLSSQDHHRDDPNWVSIGSGSWDYESRASWVRLDRVLDVPEEGIRREGAILARETFEVVPPTPRSRQPSTSRLELSLLARLAATSATSSDHPRAA